MGKEEGRLHEILDGEDYSLTGERFADFEERDVLPSTGSSSSASTSLFAREATDAHGRSCSVDVTAAELEV